MNLLFAQVLTARLLQSGGRVARVLPALLCLLLFSAVPAFADPVRINQVIQTLSSTTGAPDLKLSTLVSQQDPAKSSSQTGQGKDGNGTQAPKTDSVISGVTVGQGQQLGVQIIEEAEVEGTICDCGEIYIAGGGIPKWPFLFLAAVPLVFIDTCCDETSTPTPTPTPTPPSTPTPTPPGVPEPASMLLLGTGLAALGAGVRRRYSKTKAVKQDKEEE
ncbi:MAG TPA: PEP-CTERM sorting domain-containing protein [Pyrinomonadaceae bacterium]|nr:PEP-CTERM sorting domain-containing protein [Pyrinomonadaceae bacterium]